MNPETLKEQAVQEVQSNDVSQGEIDMSSNIGGKFIQKENEKTFGGEQVLLHKVIDPGASNSRGLALHSNHPVLKSDIRVWDSRYATVENFNMSVYKRTSDAIEDNGEYIITELPDSPNIDETMFDLPVHVIKGNLISITGRTPRNINNQHDKSNDIGLYINILTTIANEALIMGASNIKQKVAILLPPKERYSNPENLETIKKRLSGKYEIEMPRYGFTLSLEIDAEDVYVEAEGETAFMFFAGVGPDAAQNYQELSDQLVVVNDLGSSTFNLSLIDSLRIQSSYSHTSKFGGENLISILYQILSRSLSIPITFEQAKFAVENGYIKSGTGKISVGVELTRAKTELAEKLYKEYVTFLQIANLHATTIHTNLFVGRGMLGTGNVVNGEPDSDYSPSIGQILNEMYLGLSPNTRGKIVPQPGLANLLGLATVMRFQWKL